MIEQKLIGTTLPGKQPVTLAAEASPCCLRKTKQRLEEMIKSKRNCLKPSNHNEVVRREFRKLLEFQDDLRVIGEVKTGYQAMSAAQALHPDVVLMDLALPLPDGLEAALSAHLCFTLRSQ
jgi:CheY-like chemotaxis protein